ncbi:hypothetical protein [uncultured Tateyamaria sp.]|uniref:hypothetical protein n=1 Tax=uncultured Tateyamaria sp. TaxID=455651 RepID=UPI0026149705|nr:hypothetical protein [uncultured Tateyamaria sp.]
MLKEPVVVPGAVAKKTIATEGGFEYSKYEPIQHLGADLGPITVSLAPGEWEKARMYSMGVHICQPEEEVDPDSEWEAVVFGEAECHTEGLEG